MSDLDRARHRTTPDEDLTALSMHPDRRVRSAVWDNRFAPLSALEGLWLEFADFSEDRPTLTEEWRNFAMRNLYLRRAPFLTLAEIQWFPTRQVYYQRMLAENPSLSRTATEYVYKMLSSSYDEGLWITMASCQRNLNRHAATHLMDDNRESVRLAMLGNDTAPIGCIFSGIMDARANVRAAGFAHPGAARVPAARIVRHTDDPSFDVRRAIWSNTSIDPEVRAVLSEEFGTPPTIAGPHTQVVC